MIMQRGRVKIAKAAVDAAVQKEALEEIRLFLSSSKGHQVVTLNSEMLVRAESDEEFRRVVKEADLVVPDGLGVLAAASYLRKKTGKLLPDLAQLLLMPLRELFAPRTITDVLPGCKLTSINNAPKQGDKTVEVEINFAILEPIKWNGIPAN